MSIRVKAKQKGGLTEVKVLAKHPMETGLAKDKSGKTIPAHYIERLTATVGGEEVFAANLGPAVSKNPYLKFYYKGAAGDAVSLSWVDNKGEQASTEAKVK
jgi:sulfur-oxidizing protein SoxZ